MTEPARCPDCGAAIPDGAAPGLCPHCAFAGALKLGAEEVPKSKTEPAAGQRIGRYKLLEKIGEGGCGVVYMAEQEEPIRRRVALKVIKPGMDSREITRANTKKENVRLLEDYMRDRR